jgi:hypothetical protein
MFDVTCSYIRPPQCALPASRHWSGVASGWSSQ